MSIEKQKRLLDIKTYLFLALCFLFVFVLPNAFAVDWPWEKNNDFQMGMLDQILNGPTKVVAETFSSDGTGMISPLWQAATGEIPEGTLADAFKGLKLIGLALAMVVCAADALKKIENEQNPQEAVWESLTQFFVVAFLMINVDKVIEIATKIGETILENFTLTYGEEEDMTSVKDNILLNLTHHTSGGWIWQAGATASLILPWGLSVLVDIGTKFAMMQIALELFIRKFFTPIAIWDIYKEGIRSPGVRWLKKYVGAYIKAAVCIVLALFIRDYVSVSLTGLNGKSATETLSVMVSHIAVNLTTIGVMLKAGEYTNDIMGA